MTISQVESYVVDLPGTWEREIHKLLLTYARIVDEQRFHDWLDIFTDDGHYSVVTYENEQANGLRLASDNKEEMKLRAAQLIGVWQNPRGKTLHIINNVEFVRVDESTGEVDVENYLVVYRTNADGETALHCVGKVYNTVVRRDETWLFKKRHVVVDNSLLPSNFAELL